ncbi:UNVERIFIED_CONTAM: hypothetical protein FKN15_048943 [Acipenser sinensis]
MILKSACSNNPSYIDRLISVFMRSLQKMVRDHLNPQATPGAVEPSTVTSELVMLSLDLVKTRLAVMSMDMRKNFVQVILTSLIEKSPDAKILRAVVKIVEEWVKNNSPMAVNQVHHCCLLQGLRTGPLSYTLSCMDIRSERGATATTFLIKPFFF